MEMTTVTDTNEKIQLKNLKSNNYHSYSESDIIELAPGVKPRDMNRWRQAAIVVAILSTVASFAIAIAETVVARVEKSSAAFALAFTALLDGLTSVVVCWRFFKEADIYSQRKEHLACVIFGIVIIISALGTAGKCIFGLVDGDTPDLSDSGEKVMLVSSILSACICYVIFIINIVIAKKLTSWVIFSDALDSLVGGIIATSIIVTSEITKSNPRFWYLDETIGLATSILLIAYGIWLSVKHFQDLEKMREKENIEPSCGWMCQTC